MRITIDGAGRMRRALIIALVLIVVVSGLPVLMGMDGMASCEMCDAGVLAGVACLAVLAAAIVVLRSPTGGTVRDWYQFSRSRLLIQSVERPPQIVTA